MKSFSKRIMLVLLILAILVSFIAGCSKTPGDNEDTVPPAKGEVSEEELKYGGTLKIATDAEPVVLDMMVNSATLTWSIAWHMFENLFTMGSKQEIIPMLAKDYTIDEEGLVYTINLRENILFHNGNEMTSADVIASLNRWAEASSTGKSTAENIESIEALDDYQIQIVLREPDSVLLTSLAIPTQGAIIIPKELAEESGVEPMKEYIGTGPYKFIEWQPNQFIRLKRFDEYKQRDEDPNGYGGRKVAYVDELYYTPVPDSTVQTVGVETGQFDYAYAASSDDYDELKNTEGIQTVVSDPRAWLAFILNTKEGIMRNMKIRQAFMSALDMEEILMVSRGHKDFWRMDPGLNQKETIWWTDIGKPYYNQKDPEKARKLLAEAGYNKEPIRWMASYESYYNAALTAKSQLEDVGFVIDLQKYEPSAESDRRKDSTLWDVSVTGYTMRPDPVLNSFIASSSPGWWENEEVKDLLAQMRLESDYDTRYAMWERIEELFYNEAPYVKVGDYATLRILSERVKNFQKSPDIFFWNVWLED